jgi:hypothetical protein
VGFDGSRRKETRQEKDLAPDRSAIESVLDALARALQLDEAERAHLFELARARNSTSTSARTRRRPTRKHVRAGVQRLLDAMTTAPA